MNEVTITEAEARDLTDRARTGQPHRGRLEVRHEGGCPAATELLAAAVDRWRAGGAA